MNTVNASDIARALKIQVRSIQLWAQEGRLPGYTMVSAGRGRPQMQWNIPDLPASLTIKGKQVEVRDPVRLYLTTQQIEKEHQNGYDGLENGTGTGNAGLREKLGTGAPANLLSDGKVVEGSGGHERFGADIVADPVVQRGKGKNANLAKPVCASEQHFDGIGAGQAIGGLGVDRVISGSTGLQANGSGCGVSLVDGGGAGGLGVHSPKPAICKPNPLANLNKKQKEIHYSIRNIVKFVNSYGKSVDSALEHLNAEYAAQRLTHGLRFAYEHCWDKKRADSKLNRSTYNKWLKRFKRQGHYAPLKIEKDFSIKPWHALALSLRKRPQGSTLAWIADQVNAQWDAAWGDKPLDIYSMVLRFFDGKCSVIDQLKGRHTGSALRSHKFYQKRTSEGLLPAEEVHADGWNTHFTAPHPVTGEFVTYEVWHFHDVATRYVTPYGLGLTEKFEVIAKGLENFIRVFGVPLIVMTDSTKIVRGSARFTKDPVRSIEERVGCTIVHPKEVGNSQANGICENYNTSWLDKCSRELATYQSPGQMDNLSFKRVKKITAEMVKAANSGDLVLRDQKRREAERMGKGRVFGSYAEAVGWLNATQEKYNHRPHGSLPKVRGENGKLRHQTPAEALAAHIANGWEPVLMGETREAHEAWLADVFRPRAVVKVYREAVSPYGGMRYRNPDVLGHWNGKEVVVVYDIHDWQSVRVEELDGTLICVAEYAADTPYRAKTAYEDAEDKRARAQIRHKEKGIEKILARNPAAAIEAAPVKTIVDFLDVTPKAPPPRELTAADFMDAPKEMRKEASYEDTLMWLRGEGEDPRNKEVATR